MSKILELREYIMSRLPDYVVFRYRWSELDPKFLALALCGEAGELANLVKKEWRDERVLSEEIRDEIADIRVYLELIAHHYGISGDKLDEQVASKFEKVIARYAQD